MKCALPTVIQFDNMDNVARSPCLFLFLHNLPVFINTTGQWYHPVYPDTGILKAVIMRSIPRLISFEIRILHIFKKLIFDNIKSRFLHSFILIMEKAPRLAAKDYTFDPTIYIPHIGQR